MRAGFILSYPAQRYSEKLAIIFKDKRWTFAEVNKRINQLANALMKIGLTKGERVATLLGNSNYSLETRFAFSKSGLVFVRLNVRDSIHTNAYILNHSETRAIIVGEEFKDSLPLLMEQVPSLQFLITIGPTNDGIYSYESLLWESSPEEPEIEVSYDDIERIAYTSGTTGRPKGAIHTYGSGLARLRNEFMNQDIIITPNDILLSVAPLTHAAGLYATTFYIKGAANLILEKFEPEEVLRVIDQEKVTCAFFIPTMIYRLIETSSLKRYNYSSRCIFYGASPISPEKLKMAIEVFGNVFRQNYGMTEANQPILILNQKDHAFEKNETCKRLSSAGKPALGVEVKVLNFQGREIEPGKVGEICVRGDSITRGYWKQSGDENKESRDDWGWFHTGDMATVDEDGYVYIVGRSKDMIISGGFNIYPKEIEDVILKHSGVQEVAVIGVPDDLWGESIKAFVVSKQGCEIRVEEIQELCVSELGGLKKPKSIEIVEFLPKNPAGKILKGELRERYWKGHLRKI